MKRTSTTAVLVAALALTAALAAGLISSATAGTLAHASKHKAKPKALSCKSLISPSLLIHDVAVDTGTAPDVDPATEVNPHYDRRGPLKGITLRLCSMFFTNGGYGNVTAYGYFPNLLAPVYYWYAGTAVTTREFNRIYDHETVNSGLQPGMSTPFSKKRIKSLGYGSRAFMETMGEKDSENRPPKYPTSYGLCVLSKGKHGKPGNVLILWAWPLSLSRDEQIVTELLRHKRF